MIRNTNVSNLLINGSNISCEKEKSNLFADKLENTFKKSYDATFENEFMIKVEEFFRGKRV